MTSPKWKEIKGNSGNDMLDASFPDCEIVEHKICNQTNADANNNKFFSIELQKCSNGLYRVYTNYGRVDSNEFSGAVGLYGPGTEYEATEFFNKKFKSKCSKSKGYIEISFVRAKVGSPKSRQRTNMIDESEIPVEKKSLIKEDKPQSKSNISLDPITSKLVEQWYRESSRAISNNAAVTITSDGIETPLGVLTFKQIKTGREILGEIVEAIKDASIPKIRKLTSDFYTNIPAKLGRKITDEDLINSDILVQTKIDLLQMMEDALEIGGSTYVSDTVNKYIGLGMKSNLLQQSDKEYQRIEQWIKQSRGHNHYGTTDTVRNILSVELNADRNRYNKCSINNETELFHGSRNCNILGLCSKGLLIAPPCAPVSGYMFDKGIYLASCATKSINYSLYSFPGMGSVDNCFLFVIKAKLGKIKELQHSDSYASKYCIGPSAKFNSVKGCKGRSLIHDEYIVYALDQATITHIIELKR